MVTKTERSITQEPDGSRWTVSQVAEIVGRDVSTIRRWVRKGYVEKPHDKMTLGEADSGAFVWLYDKDNVLEMIRYANGRNAHG